MKVSKLIRKLNRLQAKHGDLDVVVLEQWNSCLGHDYKLVDEVKIAKPKQHPQIYIR